MASTFPNLSALVDVPANFMSAIAVESVIPFVIVAKPEIETLGVKLSSEIIAILFPSLKMFVMFCVASLESSIESKVKPLVVPVVLGGPTSIDDVPL